MGQTQSSSLSRSVSVTSDSGGSISGRSKQAREHKRHGVVTLKMISANPTGRRGSEQVITHTITPRGCVLYPAAMFNPTVVQKGITSSGYPLLPPVAIPLSDPRAHKILVSYCNGWHIIPFPEQFSRHSGTCLILGDRQITSPPFQMKVGDCFRLGSVGLVVSEMRADGEVEQRIDGKTLEFLKDEALAFDTNGDLATLAADEERMGLDGYTNGAYSSVDGDEDLDGEQEGEHDRGRISSYDGDGCNTPPRMSSIDSGGGTTPIEFQSPPSVRKSGGMGGGGCPDNSGCTARSHVPPIGSGGIAPGERFVCYMCYETHDTEDDALVAPCECRGDTRYLHVQCLQKWYQASITGVQTQVIRTTGNGAPACKICGSAYKTAFRRPDGRKASLLEMESNGPYLSLVVVTKHDTNPGLFNTKFRLNFHSPQPRAGDNATFPYQDHQEDNIITIGRSSSCNMILDYRTVSTIHARITYEDGKFYLTDRRSSNGTMVYLQDPFPLPYQHSLKLRMGRTTLSLQAKRSWTATLRSMLGAQLPHPETASPTPEEVQEILASCTASMSAQGGGGGGSGGGNGGGADYGEGGLGTGKDDPMMLSGHGENTLLEQQARLESEYQQLRSQQQQQQQGEEEDGRGAPNGEWTGLGHPQRSTGSSGGVGGELGPRSAFSPAFPFISAGGDGEPSSRSNNSPGNTSFQSLNSSLTGVTGHNSMSLPPSQGVSNMRVRSQQHQVHPGQPGRSSSMAAEDLNGAEEEEEEVRRAIELSLMELALQQQRQEQAALEREKEKESEGGKGLGLPPLGKVGGSPQRSAATTPVPAQMSPGPGGDLTKASSKALLDYTQPELVSDSLDEDQATGRALEVGGGSGGHKAPQAESTLVTRGGSGTETASAPGLEQELSTALPTAGAFTPFGQVSSRRSTPNLQQAESGSGTGRAEGTKASAAAEAALGRESSFREGAREGGKEGGRGGVSRENSARGGGERVGRLLSRESSVSNSTGALHPVGSPARQGSGVTITSTAAEGSGSNSNSNINLAASANSPRKGSSSADPAGSNNSGGSGREGEGREGDRSLQRNPTAIDLDNGPTP